MIEHVFGLFQRQAGTLPGREIGEHHAWWFHALPHLIFIGTLYGSTAFSPLWRGKQGQREKQLARNYLAFRQLRGQDSELGPSDSKPCSLYMLYLI